MSKQAEHSSIGVPIQVPSFADSQRSEILELLRAAKMRGEGVRRADLIFQYRFTQCGSRVFELEKEGFEIEHRQEPGQRYVTYFLVSEPDHLKPLPDYRPKQRELAPCFSERVKTDSRGRPLEPSDAGPLFGGGAA